MSKNPTILTANLEEHFRSLRRGDLPKDISWDDTPSMPNSNYAPSQVANTKHGLYKQAGGGIIYGQPQFFSPVHTPMNWQIPSKRKEIYQWLIVDGQLLREDYTYQNIHEFIVNGDSIKDSITGGLMWDDPVTEKILSGCGEITSPTKWGERQSEDKLAFEFSVYGSHRSFSVSEEHGVYVIDGKWWRKKKKIEANSSDRKKKGIVPNGVVKVKIPSQLVVKKDAKDVSIDDYLLTPAVPFSNVETIGNDMAYLIGLCAADGCIKSRSCVTITSGINDLHISSLEDIVKGISNNLTKCDTKVHDSSDNALRSTLQGDGIGDKIGKYLTGKHTNKKFTKEVFNLSEIEILNLLAGYLDGDGSYAKELNSLVANNYSEDMTDQIWWMLIRCGIRASTGKYPLSGEHYPTLSTHYHRIFIPSSEVARVSPYMRSSKISKDFVADKTREQKFFYEDEGVRYFCQPIKDIRQFKHTGTGYDMQIDPSKSYVLSGHKVSNCRFYYENEAKIASSIDFYSLFPVNGFQLECKNRYVKRFFEKLVKKINLSKWLRVISHEAHLLGDAFPFTEIDCNRCQGSGQVNGQPCDHPNGVFKRLVILNPEYVEVFTNPLSPDPVMTMIPDDELKTMILKKIPGHEKLSPRLKAMIISGQPIPLDNRCVSHIKYGNSGYNRYGTSLIRRLFPVLAYKTKLMTAQWIVAERLIIPIKIVKVGSDERPAGPQDIANVQAQLAQTANDPNLTLVTHHAFELDFFGASGKVLQLSNEFDLINQEILDGMMINKALLNGEGPTYSNAAIGVEAMIDRLEAWRSELKEWVEEKLFLQMAIMWDFKEKNEWGEMEYIYPKLKWNIMHLRDQQNYRQFMLQLHEKGLVSAQRVLDTFDIDYDEEIDLIRFERSQGALGVQQPGAGGGMGGGAGGMGGGMGDIGGGGLDGGAAGGMEGGMGGGMEGGAGGAGGAPGGAPTAMASTQTVNIREFGGRVLKPKTRDVIQKHRQKLQAQQGAGVKGPDGFIRGQDGRILLTSPERELMRVLIQKRMSGDIKYQIIPQFPIKTSDRQYSIDFAIPQLQVAIEVDGEMFHSNPEQLERDKKRDTTLSQKGWTTIRFTESEIDSKLRQVTEKILTTIMQKEAVLLGGKK
jgi:very-short-patch-repair endonuclease